MGYLKNPPTGVVFPHSRVEKGAPGNLGWRYVCEDPQGRPSGSRKRPVRRQDRSTCGTQAVSPSGACAGLTGRESVQVDQDYRKRSSCGGGLRSCEAKLSQSRHFEACSGFARAMARTLVSIPKMLIIPTVSPNGLLLLNAWLETRLNQQLLGCISHPLVIAALVAH